MCIVRTSSSSIRHSVAASKRASPSRSQPHDGNWWPLQMHTVDIRHLPAITAESYRLTVNALARTQVESENRVAAKQKASTARGGWFGWVRGGGGGTKSEESGELSEEDHQKIMALVTEQEDALQPGARICHQACSGQWSGLHALVYHNLLCNCQ